MSKWSEVRWRNVPPPQTQPRSPYNAAIGGLWLNSPCKPTMNPMLPERSTPTQHKHAVKREAFSAEASALRDSEIVSLSGIIQLPFMDIQIRGSPDPRVSGSDGLWIWCSLDLMFSRSEGLQIWGSLLLLGSCSCWESLTCDVLRSPGQGTRGLRGPD